MLQGGVVQSLNGHANIRTFGRKKNVVPSIIPEEIRPQQEVGIKIPTSGSKKQ